MSKKSKKTQTRQGKYDKRMRADGFRKIHPWVPDIQEDIDEVFALCKRKRDRYRKKKDQGAD